MTDARLAVRGLHAAWDSRPVLRGAELDVGPGEIVAVLGGNGSGKSTMLAAVAGLLRPSAGTVHLDGLRVDSLPAARLTALGLRLLPQTRRVFPSLTVRENLEAVELGVGTLDHTGIRRRRQEWLDRFPALAAKLDQPAAALSGGEQQLVAIGRVVSTAPSVLLLDEPSAGLSPGAAAAAGAAFADLASGGAAVVLVEQNLTLARTLAQRVLRMEHGVLHADALPLVPSSRS